MDLDYKKEANEIRKVVLGLIHRGGTSHIASNFSAVDLAVALYVNLKDDDEVVWSAGWKAALEYTMLWKQGKITEEQLNSFPNAPFLGLAETYVPGVHVSGGSMGHGLPVACGMAYGKKLSNEKGTIYCIMSDGEMNEGTTWESAAVAAHLKLDNVVVIIDVNGWQAMGRTKEVLDFEPIESHWKGFGWSFARINGHDYASLEKVLRYEPKKGSHLHFCNTNLCRCGDYLDINPGTPKVIICDTIKGKGVSFFEDHLLFHYKHVEKDEYEKAMAELERIA